MSKRIFTVWFASLLLLITFQAVGQSTARVFKPGSLIIPMDNAKQNLANGLAFNIKSYGLVNALLQNNIPVHWIINDSKAKNGADFSATAARVFPSAATGSNLSFSGGPFVIDSLWRVKATAIISAYGQNVAVYNASVSFSAPVRYELMFKPKIAVLDNGNNGEIHTKLLGLAGFTSPAHYELILGQNIAAGCYTFASDPHWQGGTNPAVTNAINDFVTTGGNFLAQCSGIDSYEDGDHFHTTAGITYETANGNKDNTNLYLLNSSPLMQFDGDITNVPTGTIVNFKNNGGSYQSGTEFLIKKNPSPASGVANGDVVLSSRKVGSTATGGIVSYLGGHDYLKSSFDLLDLGLLGLDFARANDVTWNNGLRVYLNAAFVPSTRPASCKFSFAGEIAVFGVIDVIQPCAGGSLAYTVTVQNQGTGTARNILLKTVLPSGVTVSGSSAGQGSYNSGTGTWTVGDIGPSGSFSLTLTLNVASAGSYQLKSYNADLVAGNAFTNDTTILNFQTDNTPPSLTAPANVNLNSCSSSAVALGTPVVSDQCGIASLTNDAPPVFPLGTTVVTWTATDNSGNTATATQNVTVSDTENPAITAPANISTNTNSGCTATGLTLGTPVTSDNCGVASVTNNAPSAFPLGATNVIWTVTDNSGNTSTAIQMVTVTDNVNPTITAPANVSATTNSGCTATGVSLGTPVANDNCGVANVTNNAPSAFPLGTTNVTWTVTDNSGNTSTAIQTVTVTDNVNPTITAPANILTTTNSGCTATGLTLGTPLTNDNCGISAVTNNAPSAFPLGITNVTWTVTDNSGNTSTAIQTVTVTDNVDPTITAPASVSATTNSGCTATGVVLGTAVTNDNCGVANVVNDAPSAFPLGVTNVTWTVTDNSGNTATAIQTVTVTDNIDPAITAPANISTTTNSGCTASGLALGTPVTSDNCTVANVTNDAPSAFPPGTTNVTWTVTDNSGNSATAIQTITVTDNVNPTISAPANISTATNSGCEAIGLNPGSPVTNDNCGVANVENNAPATFPLGTTIVTWIVTDNSGNQASAFQNVTVTDGEDPQITSPADLAIAANSGCTAINVDLGIPVRSDNCGIANLVNNAPSTFPLGTTVVTWIVTDNSGNTATATQNVVVTDEEDPSITAPAAIQISAEAGCTATIADLGSPVVNDNCGVSGFTNDAPSSFGIGATNVAWTVTDNSGNTSTAVQVITVIDDEDPVISVQPAISATTSSGCEATGLDLGSPTVGDNCSVVNVSNNAPSAFPLGITTVIWTATDAAGNTGTAIQTVTVTDNIDPTITAPADKTVSANSGCEATSVNLGTPVTNDNCGVANVSNDAISTYPIGTTVITWTVTDNSGNTASATQNVIVVDDIAPVFDQAEDTVYSCISAVDFTLPSATDNCGVASFEQTDGTGLQSGSDFPYGITILEYTAKDAAGNISVYRKHINVIAPPQNAYAGEDQVIYIAEAEILADLAENQTGIWQVLRGSGEILDKESSSTEITGLSRGDNILKWTIYERGCIGNSDTLHVQFKDITVPNGFSPDGNGSNDLFEIAGLENYQPAELIVFNSWGAEVYRSSDYRNDWNGENMQGAALVADTYYYQLVLSDKSVFTGFIMLKRK